MRIRAIAPWFGGKRTLAPRIVAELGPHAQYFEPFCGSMAVLFAKEPSKHETVNDLHGDLVNLARVLQDPLAAPMLYGRLQRTLFTEDLLDQAKDAMGRKIDLEDGITGEAFDRAYWYFVQSWVMRNGVAGTVIGGPRGAGYSMAVRWTPGGGSPTIRFRGAIESIPDWHERLRNVVILRRDAFEILDRFQDSDGTAVYVDPPYPSETRSGFNGSGGRSRYLHDFEIEPDALFDDGEDKPRHTHEHLAELLRSYKRARIVVSSYDCPRIRELYEGWTAVECAVNKLLHQQNGRGNRKQVAPEIMLINGESYTKD
ncbi:MAG: DNA adenine methylase [Phycisphaerae bacterium]|nr:DNA adenine methylase [Phycisphaerae bacterium]